MNLTRCNNGHFYDKDVYVSCPHCNAQEARNSDVTQALTEDVVPEQKESASLTEAVQVAVEQGPSRENDKDVTVSFYSREMGVEPVVGWLVCVKGPHFGQDFRLKSGRNFVGRSSQMDVVLSKDNSVSREKHAIIVYEPRNHLFLVQPGESKELCYLNDEVVLAAQKIAPNDILSMGETDLMFFPCCTDKFNWNMVKENQPEKKD